MAKHFVGSSCRYIQGGEWVVMRTGTDSSGRDAWGISVINIRGGKGR